MKLVIAYCACQCTGQKLNCISHMCSWAKFSFAGPTKNRSVPHKVSGKPDNNFPALINVIYQ